MHRSLALLSLLLIGCPKGTGPRPLVVSVTDQAGQPVSTATVHIVEEGDQRHKVDAVDGQFTTSALTTSSGEEMPLVRDTTVTLEISAPGYRPTEVAHVMTGKKRDVITVELEAFEPVPIPEETLPVPAFGGDE